MDSRIRTALAPTSIAFPRAMSACGRGGEQTWLYSGIEFKRFLLGRAVVGWHLSPLQGCQSCWGRKGWTHSHPVTEAAAKNAGEGGPDSQRNLLSKTKPVNILQGENALLHSFFWGTVSVQFGSLSLTRCLRNKCQIQILACRRPHLPLSKSVNDI